MHENEISKVVLESALKIHRTLGPGLLESAYEQVLKYELEKSGLKVRSQVQVDLLYDGRSFGNGFRADLIVEDVVLVELKSVEKLMSVHKKQVLTYLKLAELKLGLLINFNEKLLKEGFARIVNGLED